MALWGIKSKAILGGFLMINIHTTAYRALTVFGGYALIAAFVAAWAVSRTTQASLDPQIIRDYLGLMSVVSAAFLLLTVLPAFRTWIVAMSLVMTVTVSAPALFDQSSVAEEITIVYLKSVGVAVEGETR